MINPYVKLPVLMVMDREIKSLNGKMSRQFVNVEWERSGKKKEYEILLYPRNYIHIITMLDRQLIEPVVYYNWGKNIKTGNSKEIGLVIIP